MNINLKLSKFLIGTLLITAIFNSIIYSIFGLDIVIGSTIIEVAVFLYLIIGKKDIFNPVALFSFFWLGGIGLSNFKLSYDQYNWSYYVWLNVLLAYVMFILGYYFTTHNARVNISEKFNTYKFSNDRLYVIILILFIICVLAFLTEALKLGFIPIFDKSMDAYMRFHISGVHYFTVTIGLIPSLTIIYKSNGGNKKVLLFNIVSVLISISIVSRQLLLLELIFSVIIYHYSYKRISRKIIIALGIVSIIAFSVSSIFRHQNVSYIYKVAHMKIDTKTILVQPYLYVTMNYENLRNIIENFHSYKFGTNMLFPIFAFTNTKNYFDYSYKNQYFTNPLFNTTTFLSDIYFDFGIFGVVILTFLLGCISAYVYESINKLDNKILLLIYCILAYCLIFSFFAPWLFNPVIWFYIIITILVGLFCNINKDSKTNKIINKIFNIIKFIK